MTRHYTTVLLLLSAGIIADTHADQTPLAPSLQQTLATNGVENCQGLAQLRSADIHSALADLYQQIGYVSLWQVPEQLNDLQMQLRQLADDGLDPEDYGNAMPAAAPADACGELRISADYLLALEHLSLGRYEQAAFESVWRAEALPSFSPVELALTGVDNGIVAAFAQARPSLPQYQALRAVYVRMDKHPADTIPVPAGELLRPGMHDSRLEQITQQLHAGGFIQSPASDSDASVRHYGDSLVQAVRRFQVSHGLVADGIIGPQTLNAMNISPRQRVQQVRINLERLRWINAQRHDYLLLVNIASGDVQLMRGDQLIWRARAQTGRASRRTPAIVSSINRITLNPSWTVPPTILREDVLPQIRGNPDYLASHGMQALDAQGEPLDPGLVNWNNPHGIVLRQPPGPTNPLGQLVFRLPNPFSIYLHDTPSQHLFEQPNRNVSSGCVRVEEAQGLAEQLLAGLPDSRRQLITEQLASGQTHEVALSDGPQVILAYWTAYADADGKPAFIPDIYRLDDALIAAMTAPSSQPVIELANTVTNADAGCAFSES